MNPNLSKLQPYPFQRLNQLIGQVTPVDKSLISLSIGEPKHAAPQMVIETLKNSMDRIGIYPKTAGTDELRQAISNWGSKRFILQDGALSAQQVLPLNGTREGLFSFIQAAVAAGESAKVLMPNPFYQIYEGACYLAGASPVFLNCTAENGYLPDIQALAKDNPQILKDCQLLIICSPSNPTGTVMPAQELIELIKLADQYDFIIASDECYSEIYFDEQNPPCGLLQACQIMGRTSFERCVVFHSLSKRSNLPGLRSGFVAGDKDIINAFLQYRTYHGCAMSEPVQQASIAAWSDENHVIENRKIYQQKFTQVLDVLDGCLDVSLPEAAFYLWPKLPSDDETFCQQLFAQQHVLALPGQYLSRSSDSINPGSKHARLALVATEAQCLDAAKRIKQFMQENY